MKQEYRLSKHLPGSGDFFRSGAVDRDSFDAYCCREACLHTHDLTRVIVFPCGLSGETISLTSGELVINKGNYIEKEAI